MDWGYFLCLYYPLCQFFSNPKEGTIITYIAFISYSLIVLLEYFNIIPNKGLFKITSYLYQDTQYIVTTLLLIGVVFALIFITDKNFAQILKEKNDKSEKNIDKINFVENENTIGWVVKNKKFLYIEDLENNKHFSKIKIIRRRIKQILIIPIIVEDKVIGIINLENTSLSPDTIDLLRSFSEGAAVSINNARLYQKIQDSYFEIAKALA